MMLKNFIFSMLLFLFSTQYMSAQYQSIIVEVMPVAFMKGNGTGLNATYKKMFNNKLGLSFSMGMIYDNFHSGLEREFFTMDGEPIERWSTEVDIYMDRPYPLGGIVNDNDFSYFEQLGITHYKPRTSYRLNRYIILDFVYSYPMKKWAFHFSAGPTLGLTNRDDVIVGFTGEIMNNFAGDSERFWVNFNFRSKYLYFGTAGKLALDYHLSEKLSLGLSCGVHYIFDRHFGEDDKLLYLGLTVTTKI